KNAVQCAVGVLLEPHPDRHYGRSGKSPCIESLLIHDELMHRPPNSNWMVRGSCVEFLFIWQILAKGRLSNYPFSPWFILRLVVDNLKYLFSCLPTHVCPYVTRERRHLYMCMRVYESWKDCSAVHVDSADGSPKGCLHFSYSSDGCYPSTFNTHRLCFRLRGIHCQDAGVYD